MYSGDPIFLFPCLVLHYYGCHMRPLSGQFGSGQSQPHKEQNTVARRKMTNSLRHRVHFYCNFD